MNKQIKKSTLSIALAASMAGAVWSSASQACGPEPYIASVCAMAMPNYTNGFNEYVLAAGQTMTVSQNQALYALIGNTYGGTPPSTFALPDLRGRVIVGAGQGAGMFNIPAGQMGGSMQSTLQLANLPPHNHGLTTVTVNTSKLAVSTTLSGLAGTLNGMATLKASTGGSRGNDPTGKTLATTTGPTTIYSDATPTIGMMNGSIDTSGLTVNVTGTPSSTLTGTASLSGATDNAGQGASFNIMQPYLGMYYYIATQGVFPNRN